MSGINRLRIGFAAASDARRVAFIAYLVAGYPDLDGSVAAASAILDAGADIIEIGVPFSDPVADGPVIAEAGRRAIAAGGGLAGAREVARRLRTDGYEQPLLLMTYRNPLMGNDAGSVDALRKDGIDGLIVPDLPAGEDLAFETDVRRAGLALTFLVAPNTPAERLTLVARHTTGFVYVVPRYGVTGAGGVTADLAKLLARVREAAGRLPVAAGFGISTPDHVAALAEHVDGVIVGTALVSAVTDGGPAAAGELTRRLMRATPRP